MNSTLFTLAQASKITGKDKSTIQRWIKSGRLSAKIVDGGRYLIDASELHRVCPFVVENATDATDATDSDATKRNILQRHGYQENKGFSGDATVLSSVQRIEMQQSATEIQLELERLRTENAQLKERIGDFQQMMRLLEYKGDQKDAPKVPETPVEAKSEDDDGQTSEVKKKGFMSRLFRV